MSDPFGAIQCRFCHLRFGLWSRYLSHVREAHGVRHP